jgi:hypothetical protein
MTLWLKVGAFVVSIALAVSVAVVWKDAREQQSELQAELKSTQQALAEATSRQTARDTALQTLLAQLKKSKDTVQKPEQVIAALPGVLPLPEPVTLGQETTNKVGDSEGKPVGAGNGRKPPSPTGTGPGEGGSKKGQPNAEFPTVDLKPLYDFAVDCKSCQAQLAAAQADLKDEQTKEHALGRERDDALRTAKGGSVLRRVLRAAKWFAIGAAAGAIAAKAAH